MHEFDLPDMSCGHCASVVKQACQDTDPQVQVEVHLGARQVRLVSGKDRALFAEALSEAGYPPVW